MKKLSIYFLILLSNITFAQRGNINSLDGNSGISSGMNNLLSDDLQNILNSKPTTKSDADIQGSIFFDKDYRTAKITGVADTWPIRYDAYRDEIEVKKNDEVFALKKESPFNEITFIEKNNKMILAEFNFENKMEKGYLFEILSYAKYALYKKQKVVFKKGKDPKTTLEIATPNRFIPLSPTYFVKTSGNNEFIEIDKKAKNIITNSPDKKSAVNKCLKEAKLDLNQEFSVKNFAKCLYD